MKLILVFVFLTVTVYGAGSYTYIKPSSIQLPAHAPYRTSNLSGPVLTTDWCASLVFDSTSNNMFAHPLAFKCESDGIWIGYPNKSFTSTNYYSYPFSKDIKISIAGLSNQNALLDKYSDWCATASWKNGAFKATFGHGMPFVYFHCSSGVEIEIAGEPQVWYNSNGSIGLTMGDRHYGLYAPGGSQWIINGKHLSSTLKMSDYFSIAALPDTQKETFSYYHQFAYNFITDTKVSWQYNQKSATVTATYQSSFERKEGNETGLLYALYPHQWLYYNGQYTKYTYNSVCGPMKVIENSSFTTTMPYTGILPGLPLIAENNGRFSKQTLQQYIDNEKAKTDDQLIRANGDTYWTGKDFGRTSALVRIAEQIGDTAARDRFLRVIKAKLENWLTYTDGEVSEFFYYDSTWNTLIGVNSAYDSDKHINDHHFHYGYYIMAAATVAQYDRQWASEWKQMVDMIIRDANSPFRNDTMFPFLRAFDIYSGHCWASGDAEFASGNNQESTSESVNLSSGIALWGLATRDTVLRNLGIFLYTTETAALKNYWFDMNNIVFPADFDHTMVGMIWGEKADYATWFSAEPECIHGINMLPITASSLYLGTDPEYVKKNYAEIEKNNNGPVNDWKDILWEYLAFTDAKKALDAFEADKNYAVESGESEAHTYHWLQNLFAAGQVNDKISANVPCYAAFDNSGIRTYVVYNEQDTSQNVVFSDGEHFSVKANALVYKRVDRTGISKQVKTNARDFSRCLFAHGMVILTVKNSGFNLVKITDTKGRLVTKFSSDVPKNRKLCFKISEFHLSEGCYFITVHGGNSIFKTSFFYLK